VFGKLILWSVQNAFLLFQVLLGIGLQGKEKVKLDSYLSGFLLAKPLVATHIPLSKGSTGTLSS
jgi:hypothetical protein